MFFETLKKMIDVQRRQSFDTKNGIDKLEQTLNIYGLFHLQHGRSDHDCG